MLLFVPKHTGHLVPKSRKNFQLCITITLKNVMKQDGAELGQAQYKLRLDVTFIFSLKMIQRGDHWIIFFHFRAGFRECKFSKKLKNSLS